MKRIRKGDEVIVISGKDRGRRGVVLRVDDRRVVVEGVNVVKKHIKADPQAGNPGGILEQEAALDVSNVQIWNPMTEQADKVGYRRLADGRKVRYFKSNDEVVVDM